MRYLRRVIIFGLICFFWFSSQEGYTDDKTTVAKLREEIEASQKLSQQAKELQNEIIKAGEKNQEIQVVLGTMATVSEATAVVLAAAGVVTDVVYIKELLQFKSDLKALSPSLDSSKLKETTVQQKLTPVNVSFTQAFDGLFTQSADYLNSPGGNHSGTFTDGTRVGAGSRPGNFTSGSFSGRTIAETGYTPATFSNVAFSGSSVGTATAKGFQEGDLKGSMTVTVPAGTQTATVSGNITISTDGSLSMPSYSGPVTDNGTSTKVGTMSGSWSQGPTQ